MPRRKDASVVELVSAYADLQRKHLRAVFDSFCRNRLSNKPSPIVALEDGMSLEAHLGRSFGHLARMAQLYAKKVLRPTGVANLEDFGYLAQLSRMEQPRKKELIRSMHTETTSGSAVIKRLVAQGWVQELNDPDDGRSIRIKVTAKGHNTLKTCFPRMTQVGNMVFGLLDPAERVLLMRMLKKLEAPHVALLTAHREKRFEQLMASLYGPVEECR